MTRPMTRQFAASLVCVFLFVGVATAQDDTVTVTVSAPIYIGAQVSQTPLRVAAMGTRLRRVAVEGDWMQVEFNDPRYGRRIGWIQHQFVRTAGDSLAPLDLSISPTTAAAAPPAPVRVERRGVDVPKVETALGWTFLHVEDEIFDVNSSLGWYVNATTNITPWLGIAVDASGHYNANLLGIDEVSGMVHSGAAGPRFSFRTPYVAPYGEFLLGVNRTDISVLDENAGSTDFMIQPGGGALFTLTPTFGLNAGFAWRRVFYEDEPTNMFRFTAGVVFRY